MPGEEKKTNDRCGVEFHRMFMRPKHVGAYVCCYYATVDRFKCMQAEWNKKKKQA